MAVLTGIETPHRGSRRRVLMLDGEEWRTTSVHALRRLGLETGHEETPEGLAERLDAAEYAAGRDRAIRQLTYRDRTSHELAGSLQEDGLSPDVATRILDSLRDAGFVDDERCAHAAARVLTQARGHGRARAQRELARRGLSPETVAAALDEAAPESGEHDRALAAARAAAPQPGTDPGRVAAHLVRRGFRPATALRAAGEALAEREAGLPGAAPGGGHEPIETP